MSLHICHNHRLEALFDPAAALFNSRSSDPFTKETILVQSLGMGRFFVLEMARRLGVFANYRIIFPNQLFFELGSSICDESSFPDKSVSSWTLFELLQHEQNRLLVPGIDEYDNAAADKLHLLTFSQSIADLFDQYTLYRPQTVLAWENEKPVFIVNGFPHPLPEDSLWQMHLWSLLSKQQKTHRAKIHEELLEKIPRADLSAYRRLIIFGVSTLPLFHLQILHALSERIPVYLFLLNPSESSDWFNDVSENVIHRANSDLLFKKGEIKFEDHYLTEGNMLLTRNGREGAEFFSLLAGRTESLGAEESGDTGAEDARSILSLLQNDIASHVERPAQRADDGSLHTFCREDRSLRIGACYGPSREIEILHDEIIGAFEEDPSLEPKDILVMVPDIELYASYIKGVFDVRTYQERTIPYSIADLSITHDNEIASLFISLCEMVLHGITFFSIKEFISRDAVRLKSGVSADELASLLEKIYNAGFRWGRDGDDHEEAGARFDQNSWHFTAQRLWAGFAFDEGEIVQEAICSAGMDEALMVGAGRIIGLIDTVVKFAHMCETERSAGEWSELCREMTDKLFLNIPEYSYQIDELAALFASVERNSRAGGFDGVIPFSCFHHCVSETVSTEKRIFGFLDGRITFCEMLPMRSIPFKMICMLGMNSGTIPRESGRSSYDLTKNPLFPRQKGDRDRRDDDRYLFLETLLSARSRLYMSYNAKSSGGGKALPPSLLVSELLEYLDRAVDFGRNSEGGIVSAFEAVVVSHFLQPFAGEYFSENTKYISYNASMFRAASSLYSGKIAAAPSADLPLPVKITMSPRQVIRYFQDPHKFFLKNSLHASLRHLESGGDELEPLHIDYGTQRAIFQFASSCDDVHQAWHHFSLSGSIPPLEYGRWLIESNFSQLRDFALAVKCDELPSHREIYIERKIGTTLLVIEGTLPLYGDKFVSIDLYDSAYHKASGTAANILLSSSKPYAGAQLLTPDGSGGKCVTDIPPASSADLDRLAEALIAGHRHPLHYHYRASYKFVEVFSKGKYKGNTEAALAAADRELSGAYSAAPGRSFSFCFPEGFPFYDDEFTATSLALFDILWREA